MLHDNRHRSKPTESEDGIGKFNLMQNDNIMRGTDFLVSNNVRVPRPEVFTDNRFKTSPKSTFCEPVIGLIENPIPQSDREVEVSKSKRGEMDFMP